MVCSIAAADPVRQAFSASDSDLGYRAYVAASAGQTGDAITIYSEAIRRHPDSYMSYYRRGVSYARLGQPSNALTDLDMAVRLSPSVKNANELGVRAWNSLLPETHALNLVVTVRSARANLLRELKRPKDAIADLDVAIALDPRRTNLWHTRGLLHMEAGNAPAAINDFSALLARRENVDWRFARGICHYANGNFAEAEADFAKAAKVAPNNGLYARWLAKTQKRLGIAI